MSKNKKILVIDDEPDIVAIIVFRLKKSGYDVVGVADVAEAFQKVKSDQPDLILLDFGLPCMPGEDLCRALKADPRYAKIPIIIISASSNELKERSLACGAEDYILKPYEFSGLLSKINKLLAKKTTKKIKAGRKKTREVKIDDLQAGYIEHRRSDLTEMRENLKSGDIENIRLLSHRMSGSGKLYGFEQITKIGKLIENAASGEDLSAVKRLCGKLEDLLGTIK